MTNAIRNSKVDSEMESTAERGVFFLDGRHMQGLSEEGLFQ